MFGSNLLYLGKEGGVEVSYRGEGGLTRWVEKHIEGLKMKID